MALTDLQKETVKEALGNKMKGSCSTCLQNNWTIGDELVASVVASLQGGLGLGGPYIPMVQVICNNCGFVAHYAVAKLGISLTN